LKLWITGSGEVTPASGEAFKSARIACEDNREPRLVHPEYPLREGFGSKKTRWLDRASLFWINAVRECLKEIPDGRKSEVGQVLGSTWGPTKPSVELEEAIYHGGFQSMPPAVFPNSVGNAPAGHAALLLGIKGPVIAVSAKESAGIAAIVEACRLVSSGRLKDCIAGAADHLDDFLIRVLSSLRGKGAAPPGEGAYALMVTGAEDRPSDSTVQVSGWTTLSTPTPPHKFPDPPGPLMDDVLDRLLRQSGWRREDVDLVTIPGDTNDLRSNCCPWLESRLPKCEVLEFQHELGACGASWVGAVSRAAKRIERGESSKVILISLSTGGSAAGLALLSPDKV